MIRYNRYLTQCASDDTRSECSNPAAEPHMYTGIGINFQRAMPADMNSPYTIAGLVPAVSPNEHESDGFYISVVNSKFLEAKRPKRGSAMYSRECRPA